MLLNNHRITEDIKKEIKNYLEMTAKLQRRKTCGMQQKQV